LKRKRRRVATALASLFLVTGTALLVYSYAAGPPTTQSLSFSIDWPVTAYTTNVLAYNGSVHINLFLFSNGSITQGQKVIAAAAGGMISSFANEVENVFLNFQGALPCVTKVCSDEGIIYNLSPTMLVLNKNEATDGLQGVGEIGPVNFTTSLGMGTSWGEGEGIFWQSPGTYYVSMTIQYSNGTESTPYTLETQPVYVAPAPQGPSPIDIIGYVVLTVGVGVATYVGLYLQIQERRRGHAHIRNPRNAERGDPRPKP
jgi:hypothetical protein